MQAVGVWVRGGLGVWGGGCCTGVRHVLACEKE